MSRICRATVAVLVAWVAVHAACRRAQASTPFHPDVIYGADDRLDVYQLKSPKLRALADSTVALFDAADVEPMAAQPERLTLGTHPFGERMRLCKDEPFFDQPIGAFCSGALVGPDLILTAGHCVPSQAACQGARFVFGFAVRKEGERPSTVAASDVYECARIVARKQEDAGADWAVVQLTRPVSGRKPLALDRSGAVRKGMPLFVIGHPAGLPTKLAAGASVRDDRPQGYFTANLDTFGGNSGSPVFDADSGLVEGVLVRGDADFVMRGSCRVSNRCADDGCRGEEVTRIAETLPALPPDRLGSLSFSSAESAIAAVRQASSIEE